jgi:hypothetical protein
MENGWDKRPLVQFKVRTVDGFFVRHKSEQPPRQAVELRASLEVVVTASMPH